MKPYDKDIDRHKAEGIEQGALMVLGVIMGVGLMLWIFIEIVKWTT